MDIILAMALAVIPIMIVSEVKSSSEKILYYADNKGELLDFYESHSNELSKLWPYENSLLASSSTIGALPYGNEMIERDFSLAAGSLNFVSVTRDSALDLQTSVGKNLCTVDFYDYTTLGLIQNRLYVDGNHDPASASIVVEKIVLPVDSSLPLTDLRVRNGIAYITADSSRQSDPDILVIDVHNPDSTKVLSSLNTGPGLRSLALVGNRIYAAAPSTVGQMHVIRLNGLTSLDLENRFKLALPYATATPTLASSIFYENGKVYLGTEKWAGDELNVIDVSNPAAPVRAGGLDIDTKVEDIFVHNGFVFFASPSESQLRAVTFPSAEPNLLAGFGPSGWSRQNGRAIFLFENSLSFGRDSGGYDISSDHEAFAFATSSIHSFSEFRSANFPGGIYDIAADRYRIYLISRELDREFQIFDRSLTASTSASVALPIIPERLTCDGKKLYILPENAPFIYKIGFK